MEINNKTIFEDGKSYSFEEVMSEDNELIGYNVHGSRYGTGVFHVFDKVLEEHFDVSNSSLTTTSSLKERLKERLKGLKGFFKTLN